MAQTVVVLGASLAAADLSILAGKIQITGAPAIDTKLPGAETLGVQRYVVGLGRSTRIDFSVANNTTYSFNLVSNLPSNGRFGAITCGASYTSDSSASETEIRTGLKASLEGSAAAAGLNITVTDPGGLNTYITVTGGFATSSLRDFSIYQVGTVSNVTIATGTSDAMYITPAATAGTAFDVSNLRIGTLAAHGLVPGNIVFWKGWASTVVTFRGATASPSVGIVSRVLTVPTNTTFTLEGVTAVTANTSITTEIYKVASQPMGTPAAVQAELNAAYLADGTALAPTVNTQYNYTKVAFSAFRPNAGLPGVLSSQDIVIYYAAADVASPWTVTTSGGTFETNLITALNGGSPANPALLEASSGTIL